MGMLCGFSQNIGSGSVGVAIVSVNTNGTAHGYFDYIGMGSIDPVGYEPIPGFTLSGVYSSLFLDFVVAINDIGFTLAEDAWTSITVEDGDGNQRTFLAADNVNYSHSLGRTYWSFGTGGDRVWEFTDAGEDHPIINFVV